jgi:hypothetical protein
MRRRRARLTRAGLCVRCGENPPRPGRQTCACAIEYSAARKQALFLDGRCVDCAGKRDSESKLCRACREYYSKRQKQRKRFRRQDGACTSCGAAPEAGLLRCARCKGKDRAGNLKIRAEALAHYGSVCSCCGESETAFLTFDHIAGGGTKHRETSGHHLHRWLRRNKYPSGFCVLCFNCNCGRAVAGGVCPHKKHRDVKRPLTRSPGGNTRSPSRPSGHQPERDST